MARKFHYYLPGPKMYPIPTPTLCQANNFRLMIPECSTFSPSRNDILWYSTLLSAKYANESVSSPPIYIPDNNLDNIIAHLSYEVAYST